MTFEGVSNSLGHGPYIVWKNMAFKFKALTQPFNLEKGRSRGEQLVHILMAWEHELDQSEV